MNETEREGVLRRYRSERHVASSMGDGCLAPGVKVAVAVFNRMVIDLASVSLDSEGNYGFGGS